MADLNYSRLFVMARDDDANRWGGSLSKKSVLSFEMLNFEWQGGLMIIATKNIDRAIILVEVPQ